ncbi:metallophosphoesterase [Jiella endophytica]|uniref:Metallophosphoesterase n=1 Tax=Jiella endophytica TaxID=2558362 RepID=A0A4Y8RP83_9HYPH|nr:metallophosphoesterase [Jiella endophytica]TFF25156.1 metallophosphoesterase [Jiella endophytica]
MRLFAVADLHLGFAANREALAEIEPRPDDWLILAGDVGETFNHMRLAFEALLPKFRQLVWVPGNHELWAVAERDAEPGVPVLRGAERYLAFVDLCREYGVLTPEDDYPLIVVEGREARLVPMFLLYDYSFRPPEVAKADALAWASEGGVRCADEQFLAPAPFSSRSAWCEARCEETLARLEALGDETVPRILVNHWPLREALAKPPRIPRFSLWCGTKRTEDWHRRFNASVVVSGHLHMPSSRLIDGVRFEEVSFGYPKQWRGRRAPDAALRQISV